MNTKYNRRHCVRRHQLQRLELRQLLAADGMTLVNDDVTVEQNSQPILVDVLDNDDFDPDYAGAREITSLSTGSLGGRIEITDSGNALLYTPPADVKGVETFRYTVDNGASAEVAVQIRSPLPEFTATIFLFHDEYHFDLLAGATFADDYEGERRITLISDTSGGADLSISDDGQSVVYRPRVGVSGEDRFNYIVDDRYFGTAVIDVVNPLVADRYEVLQHSGTTRLDVLENDFLSGADASIDLAAVRQDARITHVLSDSETHDVRISDDGRSVEFSTVEDHAGYQSFRYVVDGRFETNVSVYVQRPVRDDYESADINGGEHFFDVLTNDTYGSIFGSQVRVVDRVTGVTQGDSGGTVEMAPNGGGVLYTPEVDFSGTETFQYTADGIYTATVRVSVNSPVRDDNFVAYVGANNRLDVLDNDFNGTSTANATITEVTASSIGAVIEIDSNGIVVYTPPLDVFDDEPPVRSDTFEYTVNDEMTATVRVHLARITSSDHYQVDRPTSRILDVLSNDQFGSDYPGAGVITSVSDPSDGGTVAITSDGKALDYQPGSDHETFTYTVDDRFTETVTIGPIWRLNTDNSVAEQNGPDVTIDVLENDFPESAYVLREFGPYLGDRIVTDVSQPDSGAEVTITADGKVRYVPPADFFGRDTFHYTVDDFLTSQIFVDVFRRANDDVVHVLPGAGETLNVLANDILGADHDGSGLITAVSSSSLNAEITIADDGRSIVYTAPPEFDGEDQFTYTLDGRSKATVTVKISESSDTIGRFESTDQLRDYLLERSIERSKNRFGQIGYDYDPRVVESTVDSFSSASGDLVFSETNVQVAGVDEDDIVETDGNFVYTLRQDGLAIVRSHPEQTMEIVSHIEVEGSPVGMYLHGDRVTVISQIFSDPGPVLYDGPALQSEAIGFTDTFFDPYPRQVTTLVTVMDVTDRSSPGIVQRTEFDGDFSESRRIGDQVFLVLNSQDLAFEPELLEVDEGTSQGTYETEQQFVDRVTANFASLLEEALPSYESFDSAGESIRSGPLVVPDDIFQASNTDTSLTVVVSINMTSVEPGLSSTSAVISAPSSNIYASAEHLYVFSPERSSVDNEPETKVVKFRWDGQSGAIDFAAIGSVPGDLLNQFSADEFGGNLRVVTEISNSGAGNFSGHDETALFVLTDDHGVLEFVGSMQNLALGQDVKSVRFFGDRVFVTTFETIDPLYAIDLSVPTDPVVAGHVSIPGFNSYMQFISEDRLLTVGSNGGAGRAVVSLFDVSDLSSPQLIDQSILPQFSRTEANLDHHAFGWFAPHELLAIPVSRYFRDRFDDDGDGYREAIRSVQEDSLSILHIGLDEQTGSEGVTLHGEVDHSAKVRRSVFVNDRIFSVGDDAVRSVNVADASQVVDQVLFDNSQLVTSIVPRAVSDHSSLSESARAELAGVLGAAVGDVLLVSHETRAGQTDLIFETESRYYRMRSDLVDGLKMVEADFEFAEDWHNHANGLDVNGDNEVSAIDAFAIINRLALRSVEDQTVDVALRQINIESGFVDTNGDGRVSALDALLVVNQLSRQSASSGSASVPTGAESESLDEASAVFAVIGSAEVAVEDDDQEPHPEDAGQLF